MSAIAGRVARLYYEHEMTHQEIADLMGLSRVKVTRLLAEARATGIVEIRVHSDDVLFEEEESRLREQFGLNHVWIAPSSPDADKLHSSVVTLGARAVMSVVSGASTIAVGMSRTLSNVFDRLAMTPLGPTVAPATGLLGGAINGTSSMELAMVLAHKLGGQALSLPAPFMTRSRDFAEQMYAESWVRGTLELAARADVIMAGLGGVAPHSGILVAAMTPRQRSDLIKRGAVGDILGRYFDRNGLAVQTDDDDRTVGLTIEEFRKIPERLAVAAGADRLDALSVAVSTGLITALVTDLDSARALLAA